MHTTNAKSILQVTDLKTYFHTEDGVVKAVDRVDLHVRAREIVGLVGESGCGKTAASLSIMGLVPAPGKVTGRVDFTSESRQNVSDCRAS